MTTCLAAAENQIRRRGVPLPGTTDDLLFVAGWAAWLYRKRDSGAALPEMLRDELRTRLVQKTTGGVPDDL